MASLRDYGPNVGPSYNEIGWRLARLVEYCRIINADEGQPFTYAATAVNRMRKRGTLPLECPVPPTGNEVPPLDIETDLSGLFPLILDAVEETEHRAELLCIKAPNCPECNARHANFAAALIKLRAIQLRLPAPAECPKCGSPIYRPSGSKGERCLKCTWKTRIAKGTNQPCE